MDCNQEFHHAVLMEISNVCRRIKVTTADQLWTNWNIFIWKMPTVNWTIDRNYLNDLAGNWPKERDEKKNTTWEFIGSILRFRILLSQCQNQMMKSHYHFLFCFVLLLIYIQSEMNSIRWLIYIIKKYVIIMPKVEFEESFQVLSTSLLKRLIQIYIYIYSALHLYTVHQLVNH